MHFHNHSINANISSNQLYIIKRARGLNHLLHYSTPVSRVLLTVLMILIFSLSSVENLVIFIALCRPRIRYPAVFKGSRFFFANLCLANLLLTTVMIPFSLHGILMESLKFPLYIAQIAGFFVSLFITAMTTGITIITANRYIAIMKPLHYSGCFNRFSMLVLSVIGWSISVVLAIVPFCAAIFIKELPYTFKESHSVFFLVSCSSHLFYRIYIIIFVVLVYLLPLLFIVIAYSNMYCNVRKITKHSRQRCKHLLPNPKIECTPAEMRHSLSSPNLLEEDNLPYFSSKKCLWVNVINEENNEKQENHHLHLNRRRWRKVSAHSFFRSASVKVNRDHNEHHYHHNQITKTELPVPTASSLVTGGDVPTTATITGASDQTPSLSRKPSFITPINASVSSLIKRSGQRLRSIVGSSQRDEIMAAMTCLIIVATFAVLVTPYFTLFILQAFHTTRVGAPYDFWNTISVLLLYLNCMATPLIYVYRDKTVRRELVHLYQHKLSMKSRQMKAPLSREASIRLRKSAIRMYTANADVYCSTYENSPYESMASATALCSNIAFISSNSRINRINNSNNLINSITTVAIGSSQCTVIPEKE